MSELKPCPFCGSENLAITYFGQPATAFHVKCRDCKALGPEIAVPRTPAGTICGQGNASLEWNRRTQPEATEPAQDLSAAKDAELFDLARACFGVDLPFDAIKRFSAALASSADALVADRIQPEATPQAVADASCKPLSPKGVFPMSDLIPIEKIKLKEEAKFYTHLLIQADSLDDWEATMPEHPSAEIHEIQIQIGDEVRSTSLRLLWEKLGKEAVHPLCPKCKGFGGGVKKASFTIEGEKWATTYHDWCYYCHNTGRLLPGKTPEERPDLPEAK